MGETMHIKGYGEKTYVIWANLKKGVSYNPTENSSEVVSITNEELNELRKIKENEQYSKCEQIFKEKKSQNKLEKVSV